MAIVFFETLRVDKNKKVREVSLCSTIYSCEIWETHESETCGFLSGDIQRSYCARYHTYNSEVCCIR